jgi:probable rRNA maturation factor
MTPRLRLALEIEDPRWRAAIPGAADLMERAIGIALEGLPEGRPIEVGVRLVDDGTIRALNRDWRGQDKPTNVLSFPMGDPTPLIDADFPWLIGDIVMSFDTVRAESARDHKALDHHAAHLAIHAALHLIGHDHEREEEALAMEAVEVSLLARLGIEDPYADAYTDADQDADADADAAE